MITALAAALTLCTGSDVKAQIPCLSGIIADPTGAPVPGADLDFDIALTGQRLLTPGDNSDIFGFYNVCVLPNTYHISFAPPPGTNLLGKQFKNFSLLQGQELNVTLDFGVIISGVILDGAGVPLGAVDVDIDSLPTGRVYTPGDLSSLVDGSYHVVTTTGLYSVKFDPPPGSPWNGVRLDTVRISADTTINIQLAGGVRVSGTITDGFGVGVAGVSIEVREPLTGAKYYISNDKTDSLGNYAIIAPPGAQTLRFAPPLSAPFAAVAYDSLPLAVDTVIDVTLTGAHLLSVFVYDSAGAPIGDADLDITDESTRLRLYTPHDKTDSLGQTIVAVESGDYEIKVDPPPGSILDQVVLRYVTISADSAFTFKLPLRGVVISGQVVDRSGAAVAGAVIGSLDSAGVNLRVKFNTTFANGSFTAKASPLAAALTVAPPPGTQLVAKKLENISLSVDTAIGVITLDSGVTTSALVFHESLTPATGYRLNLEAGGVPLFTPYDTVDTRGIVTVVAPAGTYDVIAIDPSGGRNTALSSITLSADTTVTLILSGAAIPTMFSLGQNYPNPFNGVTQIPYTLLEPSDVSITIYNILGQQVKSFQLVSQPAGYYEQNWAGSDDNNNVTASGVYLYRLTTRFGSATRRIVFLK